MDLYFDRNMDDKIIYPSIKAIEKYCINNKLNIIKEWGKLNKKSNINIHWGVKCIFKPNTFFRDLLLNKYKYSIIIEQGFLNRKNYRSIGINGFSGLSKIKPINCPNDRFKLLNINVDNMKINKNGYILFCGQLPWDTQVQDINYNIYINDIFKKIKKITNKKIVFRYHPLYHSNNKKNKFKITLPDYIKVDNNKDINNSFRESYIIISYNSNSLVEAIIKGIPIIALNKMSIVYELSNKLDDLNNIILPKRDNVMQKLYNISYMQYNLKELENGTAFTYIKKLLKCNE